MYLSDTLNNFFRPLAPPPPRVYNLGGSSLALFLALQVEPFLMVEATEEQARRLWQDVLFYRRLIRPEKTAHAEETPHICLLPAPDGGDVSGERAEAVYRMFGGGKPCSAVTSRDAFSAPVWSPEDLNRDIVHLETGMEVEREGVRKRLEGLGYSAVSLVTAKGQYSMRGWLLDVFPSTGEYPYRVEFFGDEIESIRVFDLETQRSVSAVNALGLMPAKEPSDGTALEELIGGMRLFFSESVEDVPEAAVVLSRFAITGEGLAASAIPVSGMGVLPEERKGVHGLARSVKALSMDRMVVLVSSSGGQAERLREIFREADVVAPIVEMEELMKYEGRVALTVGELSEGLSIPGLLVLTEQEIFGGRPAYRPIKRSKVSGLLKSVDDLNTGDYVVHSDYGIGIFTGLSHQSVEGFEYDLMSIDYAGGDRLHLPLYAIDRIRKFHAEEGVAPKIDRLGGRGWQRTKERVRKRIKEMAGKLLKIYAGRELAKGFRFSKDTEMHREFDSFFLYEETPDQVKAIEEIKGDMESQRPMDRLLCGDVGYGKTEVAMRAAFKAVYDGKQVAVLVPTTLLCEQHFRIFSKRFSAFPVTIDYLSRFKPPKGRRETARAIEKGKVDIVIATHSLLKPDMRFSDLGLLVIDEEHRFGVRQKERLKELRENVDVLSLSATPIPRTLQMSLSGIRSMSVIETPPEERLAVKGVVAVFDESLIREAVEKELDRGGQVFFVHNRIQDIMKVAARLQRTVPRARIAVAHGQLPERQLEEIMLSFLDMQTDVLVSTAIIGSGLDIPTANTIVIDMADRMGLADLYQLKGRVGRSTTRGFAYYLIPGEHAVREEAKKRLQAIQELSYMGAGFRLAMKDLEIRGAGNLLGAEQSGYIHAVGFDMYMEMMEKTVAELKGVEVRERVRPAINIRLHAFIPEDYLEDVALRLSVYREIVSARQDGDLEDIGAEMRDRFGPPPEPFNNLLRVMRLSLRAEKLLITDIREFDGRVRFVLSQDARLTAEKVLSAFDGGVRFLGDGFELTLEGDPCSAIEAALEALLEGER
jgi:transcription-repair coupling factor (superfamily II helicase)